MCSVIVGNKMHCLFVLLFVIALRGFQFVLVLPAWPSVPRGWLEIPERCRDPRGKAQSQGCCILRHEKDRIGTLMYLCDLDLTNAVGRDFFFFIS